MRFIAIVGFLLVAVCGGVAAAKDEFTRERADGKIPVSIPLIREQTQKEIDGMPEGQAKVERWQKIEKDHNQCRLLSARSNWGEADEVFAACMSKRGYVYMFRLDAEQLHNDIAAQMVAKHKAEEEAAKKAAEEKRIAAEKKAEEERQRKEHAAAVERQREKERRAAKQRQEEEARREAAHRREQERLAAERQRQEQRLADQRKLDEALVQSAIEENWGELKRLLAAGANPNARGGRASWMDEGKTALMFAAWAHAPNAVIKLLLDAGTDVNATDRGGRTALKLAQQGALGNAASITKLLLDAGADVNVASDSGQTPLLGAAAYGEVESVKLLLAAGADVNALDEKNRTPLIWAIDYGASREIVKLLLATGADINNVIDKDATLLSALGTGSYKEGYPEIAKTLLAAGANPNVADEDGETALMRAANLVADGFYHPKIVKAFLDAGANPNAANNNGETALLWAIGKPENAKILLAAGANPNAATDRGWTPLMRAASRGHSEETRMLLDADANPNAVAEGKKTVLGAGKTYGEMAAASKELKYDGETALMRAADNDHPEIVKMLLAAGANPNAARSDGWTALMQTADPEIVKVLLAAGANPNAATENGNTALIDAGIYGREIEIVKMLLAAGANPNAATKRGHTALIGVAGHDKPEITKILLAAGANPNATNEDGETALDIAKESKEYEVAEIIRAAMLNPQTVALPRTASPAAQVFENAWRHIVVVKQGENQGSGVIVRPNVVATNCHVIESGGIASFFSGDDEIVIHKHDNRQAVGGKRYQATIRKRDDDRDFCLLDVADLWEIPAKLRRYDTLQIGEAVYAVGSPQGLDLSLSSGLISQLRQGGGFRVIQTDAAISPGSSGGGLFDSNSNLIGILTSKIIDENVEGIGFAIPADLAAGL